MSVENINNTINSTSSFAIPNFSNILYTYLNEYCNSNFNDLIILCIGTDRSTGDCLGPLIGYKLKNLIKRFKDVYVYGTLDNPVHAKNLSTTIDNIYTNHNKPFIVAIDACLGKPDRVGFVTVNKGSLNPGSGVNKNLPSIGDINITGVVNISGFMEYVILQNTRLSTVMKMANVISYSLSLSLNKLLTNKKEVINN